jgi:AraC-like DNA-binding protein
MPTSASIESDQQQQIAEQMQNQSWVDFATTKPSNPLLNRYISSYTYSLGSLHEQQEKLITRAFPSIMTQIYFEFYGGLSEIRGQDHHFVQQTKSQYTAEDSLNQGVEITKRTYIKQGLGNWFDIYQLPSDKPFRLIKNLKVDLYPITFFELFHYAPNELTGEDLQLADLLGQSNTSLLLEEMEAASSGQAMVEIVERYFLQHLHKRIDTHQLQTNITSCSTPSITPSGLTPALPNLSESLSDQAKRYEKSQRWLQKRYALVYGMSFKQIQSNLRFQRAHQILWQTLANHQTINLTELAYSSGYFDQAHFIKDFKKNTGMTPGQYLKTNFDQQSQYLWYW